MKHQTGDSNFIENGTPVVVLFIVLMISIIGMYIMDLHECIDELKEINQSQYEENLEQKQLIDTMFKYMELQPYLDNNPLHRDNKRTI